MREVEAFLFLIVLVHREIVDKAEAERIFLHEAELLAQLIADLTRIERRLYLLVGDEVDRIADLQMRDVLQFLLHICRNKLVDRSLEGSVLQHLEIAEAAHADGLRELQ